MKAKASRAWCLSFARFLSKDGRHAPVIPDDALIFTDDDRIKRTFDALHRRADDLQIIVLSCQQQGFRDHGGKALQILETLALNSKRPAPARQLQDHRNRPSRHS